MILARLKAQTASLHEEIERTVDVFRPDFDLAADRGLLGRFRGFYEPMENRLRRVDRAFGVFFEPRAKAGRLREDLAALGLDQRTIDGLPRCDDLPECDGLASALGATYVFEGATLGGAILSRHVAATSGDTARSGRLVLPAVRRPGRGDVAGVPVEVRAPGRRGRCRGGRRGGGADVRRLRDWLEGRS